MIAAPAAAQTAAKIPAVAPSIPRASFIANMDGEFARMDVNKDGKLTKQEIEAYQHVSALQQIQARNRAVFAALDTDHNGQLSFDEWAVKTETKFRDADADKNGYLTRAEYATTAPVRKAKSARCACGAAPAAAAVTETGEE